MTHADAADARASAALAASRAARACAALADAVEAGWPASWARRAADWVGAGAPSRPGAAAQVVATTAAVTAIVWQWVQGADGAMAVVPALVAVVAVGRSLQGRRDAGPPT